MKTGSISIRTLTVAALLIAVGIVIPTFSPLKIVLEPASFTLASHVAIFLAVFLSPGIVAAVALGTTLGFFLGGFPIVVVLRAASHIVFATVGAFYLRKKPNTLQAPLKTRLFSLWVGILHALCEVAVVSPFYFGGAMGGAYYQQGFAQSVLLLVGVGTVIHSMVDLEIALAVHKVLSKQKSYTALYSAR